MSVRQNGVIIAGSGSGSVDVDNSTITTNAMDEIQAVATINANTAAGATNPVYDWVGTLAEHQAQNIETLHPDWICYITDDVSGGTSVYTKSEVDTLLTGKADTALSNITNSGKEVCANMAMPSNEYINLTLGASGISYTAPADGYFILAMTNTNMFCEMRLNAGQLRVGSNYRYDATGYSFSLSIPVSKGNSVTAIYTNMSPQIFRFVYANGAQ